MSLMLHTGGKALTYNELRAISNTRAYRNAHASLAPRAGLDPAHVSLEPLGVSAETYKAWKAGYSPSGVNRGRLALPVCARDGTVIAYCGRAITEEQQPALIFPNGVTPSAHIFGADRVKEGELILVRDPLDVLKAFENGIENVVSFLTEGISSEQLQYLSALMDERRIENLTLF